MSREHLQKVIKDTFLKYTGIILVVDSPIYIECLREPRKQQVIIEIVYRTTHGRYRTELGQRDLEKHCSR